MKAIESRQQRHFSILEWVILSLLILLFFTFHTAATAGASYRYQEGHCQLLKTVGGKLQVTNVDIEKCGFHPTRSNHTEWDLVAGKCHKVYVYISDANSEWEFRRIRHNEKYTLEQCGYDMKSPVRQSVFFEKTSNRCRKKIIYTSKMGLEDIEIVTDEPVISQKIRKFKYMDRKIASQRARSLCLQHNQASRRRAR